MRWAALHSLVCENCKIQPLNKPHNLVLTVAGMALRDPIIRVRRVAAWELGQLLPDKTAQATRLAQETDPAIRRNAQAGLKRHELVVRISPPMV